MHALITGGAGDIGMAIARALCSEGNRVTLLGRNREKLSAAAASLPMAQWVAANVTDEGELSSAFGSARQRQGPIAVLVNNAGVSPSAPILKTARADWDQTLAVNLTGAYLATQLALPDMLAAKWGRIVNVASTAGLKGYAYVSAYCAAKHGLVGLTRALAIELAATGVTANAVCPGFVDSEMTRQSVARIVEKTQLSADEAAARLAATNPQNRLISPAEVANAVAWLCAENSGGVNGAAIAIAGGEI
ncbi:MAG: SDR family NAD(P)-dependent oxidoreductase [Hyphomonadaceae bacterium]